nr:transporter substrate-binding domain-containing protein [Kaistia adipata]
MKTYLKTLLRGAALCASLSTASAESLKLATEAAYPPFNYVGTDGKIEGFDIDFGMELCKRIGADCEFVAQDWDGIIPGLLTKKYDLIVASMNITEPRKKQVAFSDPYYKTAMTHIVAKDSGMTEFSNETMKGKVIGAQTGSTQAEYVQAKYPDADIRLYPSQVELNLDMSNGRIDVMLGDLLPSIDFVKTEEGACCEVAGPPIVDPAFVGEGAGIALRQEDTALRERVNKAIAEIRADGTFKKLNDKYFTIDIYTLQ